MRSLGLSRYSLTIGAAAAFLAGCGGSQPIASPGAMPQGMSGRRQTAASSVDLLYISDGSGKVFAFSYPAGQHQFTLSFSSNHPAGMCIDSTGNVFIVAEAGSNASTVYEYAHGGTSPIANLADPGQGVVCSVDPATGNLAVVNISSASGHHGNVAIYAGATGSPTVYAAPSFIDELLACTYDAQGNLYVAGASASLDSALGEMSNGSSSFSQISISPQLMSNGISLQWNKGYLAWTSALRGNGPAFIYQLSISGTQATVQHTTKLKSHSNNTKVLWPYSWIYGKKILAPIKHGAGVWTYPKGGKIKSSVSIGTEQGLSVVVSPGT